MNPEMLDGLDVQSFADARLAALRKAAVEPFRAGDKGWLLRQQERFLFVHDACLCEKHKCSGCQITDMIAIGLGVMVDKLGLAADEAEYERTKARAEIKQENEVLNSKARDIARRVEALREQAISDRRQKSTNNRKHWQDS